MAESICLELPHQPFDVAFHPSEPLVCAGLISGAIELHTFSTLRQEHEEGSSSDRVWRKRAHKQSCRAVVFVESGQKLLSGSSDRGLTLREAASGQRVWAQTQAHRAPVNRLEVLGDVTAASGDDDGVIKVWDLRQRACCASMAVHEDFIADMHHADSRHKLLAVSGDGTLSVFDLRTNKKEARSEYAEDELLSVTVVKNGRKVVCGSQEGVLLLYSWGHFNDCSDRFPGHPQSVDALLKLSEDAVVSGSQDGVIRVVSVLPNAFRGVIGQHMDCPIERMAISGDGTMLASASHDARIKLWDLSTAPFLLGEDGEGEEETSVVEGGEEGKGRRRERLAESPLPQSPSTNARPRGDDGTPAGDLAEEEEEEAAPADDSGGEEVVETAGPCARGLLKRKKGKQSSKQGSKDSRMRNSQDFFADL